MNIKRYAENNWGQIIGVRTLIKGVGDNCESLTTVTTPFTLLNKY